jgi:hypothetical protein
MKQRAAESNKPTTLMVVEEKKMPELVIHTPPHERAKPKLNTDVLVQAVNNYIDTSSEVPILTGSLSKYSSGCWHRWQNRACQLTTRHLQWTSRRKGAKARLGSIDVGDIRSAASQGDDESFLVYTHSQDGSDRCFTFKAPNPAAREKWVAAINTASAKVSNRNKNGASPTLTEVLRRAAEVAVIDNSQQMAGPPERGAMIPMQGASGHRSPSTEKRPSPRPLPASPNADLHRPFTPTSDPTSPVAHEA